jgi:hypothetical protein
VVMVFLFLTYHTMDQLSKLTKGFDQTKNSWVDCVITLLLFQLFKKCINSFS